MANESQSPPLLILEEDAFRSVIWEMMWNKKCTKNINRRKKRGGVWSLGFNVESLKGHNHDRLWHTHNSCELQEQQGYMLSVRRLIDSKSMLVQYSKQN